MMNRTDMGNRAMCLAEALQHLREVDNDLFAQVVADLEHAFDVDDIDVSHFGWRLVDALAGRERS